MKVLHKGMDFYPFVPERNPGAIRRTARRAALCGAVALYGVLNLGIDLNKGELSRFSSGGATTLVEDNELVLVNENTARRLTFADNVGLMLRYNADIGTLQEVSRDNAPLFVERVPAATASFARADIFTSPTDGGLGVMAIARVPEVRSYMHQLEGDMRIEEVWKALKSFSIEKFKAIYQERRAALVGIYEVNISGQTVPTRVMVVHNAGLGRAARHQRRAISKIVDEEFDKSDELRIIAGDFNELPDEVRQILGSDFVVADIGSTSVGRDQQIDHFAYSPYVIIGGVKYRVIVSIEIVTDVHSDHYPYIARVKLKPARLFEQEAGEIIAATRKFIK